MDVEMVPTTINKRWTLLLPKHRADRGAEWDVWEKERLAAMHEVIHPGDVIYDIGAEEGDFPGLWASWGADVVLFEPNPKVWPNIRAIFDANGFDRKFVGRYVGFASDETAGPSVDWAVEHIGHFDQYPRWPLCAYGPVIGDHGFAHLSQQADVIPQIRIDDFVRFRMGPPPTVITIDVEGSELRVLHGAAEVLAEHHPQVFVSVHSDRVWMDEQYNNVDAADVVDFMQVCGYTSCRQLAVDHEEHWWFSA